MSNSQLPKRPKTGHKGTFGTVGVFAGHISDKSVMLGSAVFAAKSAIKSGVGLVDFFGDRKTLVELIKMLPQAVGHTFESFEEQSGKWSSVVVGPGWENAAENIKMLKRIIQLKKPTVIDGEALNILAANPRLFEIVHPECVLTPHIGEFKRLSVSTGVSDPKEFTRKFNCILVLKSSTTRVFDKDQLWELKGNNPLLATGGTGDVLTGLIAGLAAQYYLKIDLFACVKQAVEIHSEAGERCAREGSGEGLIIDELIESIKL